MVYAIFLQPNHPEIQTLRAPRIPDSGSWTWGMLVLDMVSQ